MFVIEGTRSIMGTSVAITVVAPNSDDAKRASVHAFDEISRIENLMSIYKQDSEVSGLNREGFCRGASSELIHVIKTARYYSELSDGAFDITILPIFELWQEKGSHGISPAEVDRSKGLELVNYRNIIVEDSLLRFRKPGMRLTLAGIAKGYAVDRAIQTMQREGIEHGLVNAGGDIRALAGKAEKAPWTIAIRAPNDKSRSVSIVRLCDEAIATSGSYERRIGREKNVSHIINARTGQPAQEMTSVTTITKNTIDADALSTVVFLLGPEKGMELVERLDGVEALAITLEGTTTRSSGFQRYEG
jgi:thiamine biosynthesis lipoprotein